MAGFLQKGWLAVCAVTTTSTFIGWCYYRSSSKKKSSIQVDGNNTGNGNNIVETVSTVLDEDNQVQSSLYHQRLRTKVPSEVAVVKAIRSSRLKIRQTMLEQGIPGAVVAVAKDGRLIWSEGIGLSDAQNGVACTPDTVMRIASISKSLVAVGFLQLWEQGMIDFDAPIQTYVPGFPKKTFEGKPVDITTRQLLSHLAGVRHYTKKEELDKERKESGTKDIKEFDQKEYYIKTHFNSLEESLQLFANDQPGKRFNYTTHGWSLVSAVMETVSGETFLEYMQRHVFDPLGMTSTQGEFHEPLVYNRARHYVRNDQGLLCNTPYVDNSYKWAGGGFLSNAKDLVKFGNALLVSYQCDSYGLSNHAKSLTAHNEIIQTGLLSEKQQDIDFSTQFNRNTAFEEERRTALLDPSTVALMWTPVVDNIRKDDKNNTPSIGYGLGWCITEEKCDTLGGKRQPFSVGHTGATVGASSVFIIVPTGTTQSKRGSTRGDDRLGSTYVKYCSVECNPLLDLKGQNCDTTASNGVVVAVIFNLQEVKGMYKLGTDIAEVFL